MKLSEMPTRKAAECMVDLAAPFAVIAKNPVVKEYAKKSAHKEANIDLLSDAVAVMLPVFLRDHFAETVKILAILTGKTAEEISDQSLKVTISDVRESFDGELIDFFSK